MFVVKSSSKSNLEKDLNAISSEYEGCGIQVLDDYTIIISGAVASKKEETKANK